MKIAVTHSGNFKKTEHFLKHAKIANVRHILNRYGAEGVRALQSATPIDTGKTAESWDYKVSYSKSTGIYEVGWFNTNENEGVSIALLLQYGHGTGTGVWVEGYDYINPALKSIFDNMAEEVWREVTNG